MEKKRPGRNGGTLKSGNTKNINRGPRKLVSSVVADLHKQGITAVTNVEVNESYKALLNCTELELREMSNDVNQPYLIKLIAREMLAGKGYEIVKDMLERAHGKPAGVFQLQKEGTEAGASTGSTTTIAGINIIVMGNDKPITSEDDLPNE